MKAQEKLCCISDLNGKYILVYSYGNMISSIELDYDPCSRISNLKKNAVSKLEIYSTLVLEKYKDRINNPYELIKKSIIQRKEGCSYE